MHTRSLARKCFGFMLFLGGLFIIYSLSLVFKHETIRIGHTHVPTANKKRIILKEENDGFIDLKGTIKVPKRFLPNYKNPCWYESYPGETVSKLRCLPYFYLLGVMKSGTWDIFSSLKMHPEIAMPMKEPMWIVRCHFNSTQKGYYKHYCGKKNWTFQYYLDYFREAVTSIVSETILLENGTVYHPKITADCSPDTFIDWTWASNTSITDYKDLPYHSNPELLRLMNPAAKLIVSLRNPTTRLYSDYYQSNPPDPSPEDFHRRVVDSIQKFKTCTKSRSEINCTMDGKLEYEARKSGVRVFQGIYYILFLEWFRSFPREQFFLIKFEEYVENHRTTVMNKVFNFLGLGPISRKSANAMQNEKPKKKTSRGKMFEITKHLLDEFYEPYNVKLAELLHDDYYLWSN